MSVICWRAGADIPEDAHADHIQYFEVDESNEIHQKVRAVWEGDWEQTWKLVVVFNIVIFVGN